MMERLLRSDPVTTAAVEEEKAALRSAESVLESEEVEALVSLRLLRNLTRRGDLVQSLLFLLPNLQQRLARLRATAAPKSTVALVGLLVGCIVCWTGFELYELACETIDGLARALPRQTIKTKSVSDWSPMEVKIWLRREGIPSSRKSDLGFRLKGALLVLLHCRAIAWKREEEMQNWTVEDCWSCGVSQSAVQRYFCLLSGSCRSAVLPRPPRFRNCCSHCKCEIREKLCIVIPIVQHAKPEAQECRHFFSILMREEKNDV